MRRLLNEVLVTDADFDAFCLDNFPRIKARFAEGMERLAKQNILLESISTKEILVKLKTDYPERVLAAERVLVYTHRSSPAIDLPDSEPLSKLALAGILFVLVIIVAGAFSFIFALVKFGLWIYNDAAEPKFWKISLTVFLYMLNILVVVIGAITAEAMLGKFVIPTDESTTTSLRKRAIFGSGPAEYHFVISSFWLRFPSIATVVAGLAVGTYFLSMDSYKSILLYNALWIFFSIPLSWVMYAVEWRNKIKGIRWVSQYYPEWDKKMTNLLQREGQIQVRHLRDVPQHASVLLLQRYALDHLEETEFYEKRLTYKKPQAVQDFLKELSELEPPGGRSILDAPELRIEKGKVIHNKKASSSIFSRFGNVAGHLCKALCTSTKNFEMSYADHRFYCTMISAAFIFEGTKLPENLPFFIFVGKVMTDTDYDNLRRILISMQQRTILLGVLFCDEAEAREAQAKIDSTIRQTFACDVIVVSRNDLIRIIASNDSQKLLRKHIIQQIDIETVSPFVIVGPAPDNIFFGRETELRLIVDQVRTISHAIIGGRRVGKSSLLSRLHNARLPSAGFLTIYHDCSTANSSSGLLDATILDWKPKPPSAAPQTFRELLTLPAQRALEMPLVLLLDEADKLVPSERSSGWPFFNALRALANSGRGQVVLSGERTLREALRDPQSPLFNFANELLLGPLDFRAVEELVTRPMKQLDIELIDEKQVVRRIWDFTSGHPNVVQRLCRRLLDRVGKKPIRRIAEKDVQAVTEDPKFQEEDFLNTYWERATPLEQIISILFAQSNKPHRLLSVIELLKKEGLEPDPEVVKLALDRLVDLRSILKRNQGGYEFAVAAFPIVLANATTSEDLLIVLKSKYRKNPSEQME